jgi:hypothetical protein
VTKNLTDNSILWAKTIVTSIAWISVGIAVGSSDVPADTFGYAVGATFIIWFFG